MRITLLFVCFIFSAFVFPSPVEALKSMTIAIDKATLMGDDELHVTASVSGFTDSDTVYIKGAFVQSGTSNYFGYTKFADAWIKNSVSSTSQKAITIGAWDGTLTAKSDFTDSGYKGEGEYVFKVGFYVSGGSSTVTWSTNSVAVYINEPDPTITPTPTITIQPTGTPTPSMGATVTPSLMLTPTITKIPPATFTHSARATPIDTDSTSDAAILGVEDIQETPKASVSGQASHKSVAIALLLVSLGMGLFAIASVLPKMPIWNTKEKI